MQAEHLGLELSQDSPVKIFAVEIIMAGVEPIDRPTDRPTDRPGLIIPITCRPPRTASRHHSFQLSASYSAHLATTWVHFGGSHRDQCIAQTRRLAGLTSGQHSAAGFNYILPVFIEWVTAALYRESCDHNTEQDATHINA
ncbi:hypothetical protein GGX14DRAFT_408445 [Mycena pura]|uniref:Uncharacterized protein n=1 Tax=Mycena pura TaxID=153505 RepID=A0AAD6Y3E8_9AGAR|nr:hypothetical protein GGX14DRAFT_408445 [Mycena pura]